MRCLLHRVGVKDLKIIDVALNSKDVCKVLGCQQMKVLLLTLFGTTFAFLSDEEGRANFKNVPTAVNCNKTKDGLIYGNILISKVMRGPLEDGFQFIPVSDNDYSKIKSCLKELYVTDGLGNMKRQKVLELMPNNSSKVGFVDGSIL